jgi:riboflavin kinase/FMN adenylyltransferase
MLQWIDIDQAQIPGPTFVTVGNFDGLHRGHQALLQKLRTLAADAADAFATPVQTGLITFDPHPLQVLQPAIPLALLTTPQERLDLAASFGLDFGVIQTFTPAFAQLDAAAFMRRLKQHLNLAGLVVGPDFALGHARSGDLAQLRRLGELVDYQLHVVNLIDWQARPVRSSAIRQALQAGAVVDAAALLGRFYTVTGQVVRGDQRGRQLGIPTANVQIPPLKALPAQGVYATRTRFLADGLPQHYDSVTNLGVRPTVDGVQQRLETHLLDFPRPGYSDDLYGMTVTVEFRARLRGEIRFPSVEALVTQIRQDIGAARQALGQSPSLTVDSLTLARG